MTEKRIGEKEYRYVALDTRILLVQVETIGIDWTCYIGTVPGIHHEREYMNVAEVGSKVSEELAKLYFSSDLPWRN